MRLRSKNSRSMERGTDTSRPTASGNASHEPKHGSAGRRQFNYAPVGEQGASKILEAGTGPKRENAEQELAGVSEECSLLAAKRLEERAVRDQRVLTRLLS